MYRIKEFAAMTGLPPSKIRFYEKHGLLATRREENGYRVFSPKDAFRANAFRVLLQYGFTVEQAVAMLDAEQGTDDFKRSLEDQQAKLRREADLLRYRLAKIDSALALIDGGGRAAFTLVDAPDQLYVSASVGRDFGVSVENEREIALFYDLLSITSCARIIAKRDFDAPGETVDPSYVIAMPESEEHRLEGVDRAHVGPPVPGEMRAVPAPRDAGGERAQGDVRGPVRLPGRPRLRAAGGRDPVPVVS